MSGSRTMEAGAERMASSATRFQRIAILDPMRGIAAFAVAFFHFTAGSPEFIPRNHWLVAVGQYGYLGVEMFFVISGFVIPFALFKADYDFRDYGRFLLKRVLRIDPPYFATIALLLALAWLSAKTPGYAGRPFHVNPAQLVSHIGYWTQLAGYEWLNIVFWTLAIEAQFYLLMGVVYRAIDRSTTTALGALVVALLLSRVVRNTGLIFWFLPLFAMGFVAYRVHAGKTSARNAYVITALISLFEAVTGSALVAVVGGITSALIILAATAASEQPDSGRPATTPWRWFAKLGTISYSLYLLHVPIGGRVIHLGTRVAHTDLSRAAVLGAAIFATVVASVFFYRLVELPSQRWASRIRVHRNRRAGDAGWTDDAVPAPELSVTGLT